MSEKELCIEKLQKALLKLPKDDLIKLLKNTYQAMKIKHNIPNQVTSKLIQNPNPNNNKSNKSNTKEQCVNKNSRRNLKLTNLNTINKNLQSTNTNTSTPGKGANFTATECTMGKGANSTAMECTSGKGANLPTNSVPAAKVITNTVTKDNMDKYGIGINMDDRFINMETFDTMNKDEMEEEEEITFRSQEFQVQVPELDLTLAHEYINSKHSKNIQKNEEKITTPKFSFYQTTTEGPVGTNTNQFTGNPNTITGTGTVNTVNRVNSVNLNGVTNTTITGTITDTKETPLGSKVAPFGAGGVNSIGLYGSGMNNVQYLQGYNGMIWTGGPVNFGCLRPVQIIRRPFYPRSRSLQR